MPKAARNLSSIGIKVYLLAKTRPGKEEGFANLCDNRGRITNVQIAFDYLDDLPDKIRLLLKKSKLAWPPP